MENKNEEAGQLDYQALCDLAKSRNIKYVEAKGLDLRKGIRFHKDGSEWIAVDIDLSENEKIRTLGFLLENKPATVAENVGIHMEVDKTPVLTLCCS
jgi:hypothetical protein